MKIQVRNSVFETNSSSMHSIAIVKPENLKGAPADYYGWQLTGDWLKPDTSVEVNHPVVIDDDSIDFGRWPFRVLTTMYEKAQYAIASYCSEEMFEEISRICKEKTGHSLKKPVQQVWKGIITTDLEETDDVPDDHIIPEYLVHYDEEKDEFFRIVDEKPVYDVYRDVFEEPYYGNVDHQSAGLLQAFLKKHGISLEEFLSNPQYVVIIDGDEYCAWAKMFESGLCQKDSFIETGL